MVARDSLRWLAAGLVVGCGLAVVVASGARAMLFGLAPSDPVALIAAAAMLGVSGAVATIVPALRASRLRPTSALREE
jgi:ABC-type antimicrobial peptide transport system permease subunit